MILKGKFWFFPIRSSSDESQNEKSDDENETSENESGSSEKDESQNEKSDDDNDSTWYHLISNLKQLNMGSNKRFNARKISKVSFFALKNFVYYESFWNMSSWTSINLSLFSKNFCMNPSFWNMSSWISIILSFSHKIFV